MHIQIMRWVLVGIIGICTGIVAFFIDICVRHLFELKLSLFDKGNTVSVCVIFIDTSCIKLRCHLHLYPNIVYNATLEDGRFFLGFLVLIGFNILFAIIAGLLVFAVVCKFFS